VLDAHDWGAAPVARVPLPRRVPYGFHGSWVGDDEL
jgi:carotenoid cleavage dioxygenase